ncbi:MAG: hypothetical protein A2Y97_07075 [Nitrospirae bacterium RBG_13_39_12]|nr:MAG: hypothetical protein A2Y97_07075 [Nitrospirae bacterium RBG_13_39_12]
MPVIYTYSGKDWTTINESTTFDLSDSGMSFFSETPLNKGLKLQVKIPSVWDSPRPVTVRWCSSKFPDFYKVGVSLK